MTPPNGNRDKPVICAWLVLALGLIGLAWPTIRDTGLDYDEAVYGHLTKDFLSGRHCEQHMPGSTSIELGGRAFPVFVQGYLGAVKCWMLLPTFALFGATVPVMRLTMLGWGLLGILLLMLWTRRTLGGAAAILVGAITALDPAFFFPTVCEWGAFVPSFVCRCAGLLFLTLWWQERRVGWMWLAGGALGIGFLNKIDFAVVLLALAIAALLTRPTQVLRSLRLDWRQWASGGIAFLIAGLLMIVNLVRWIHTFLEISSTTRTGEVTTKLNIAKAVLDGSYFYRLMEAGGIFKRMFENPAPLWAPLGLVLGLALVALVIFIVQDERTKARGWPMFLLLGLLTTTAGVWVLPDAVRIHHALLVYPFPQLIITAVVVRLWKSLPGKSSFGQAGRILGAIAVVSLMLGHLASVWRTQQFIATTGGRGQWSTALTQFASELRNREDVMLVSLDWGFHEQLSFLTESPQRYEPTWNLQEGKPVSLLPDPRCYYLIHPPEFRVFSYGETYLQAARAADPNLIVESRTNQEGSVVFQFFRFAPPH